MKIDRSHHIEHFYQISELNSFRDISKLLSDPYVLFLVTVAMFFDRIKIPTPVLCRIPQGTFKPGLVSIGQVVSEFLRRRVLNMRLQGAQIAHLAQFCLSKTINLTTSCPTILIQEDFGRTYHKDHFSNWKFLCIYHSFQDIGWKL